MHNSKSVRDMNGWELLHHSLQTRVFRRTLLYGLILWALTLTAGLGLYARSLVGQYIGEATVLVRSAAALAEKRIDEETLSFEVMEIYRGLSEEERAKKGTEEYHALFSHVAENPAYLSMTRLLVEFSEAGDVNDLYFGVYDRETCALVYVCDPDFAGARGLLPGDWEPLDKNELDKFLSWDGTGRLYDIGETRRYGWMCTCGMPMKNSAGALTGFILADITLDSVWNGMKNFALAYSLAMLLATLMIGFLMTRHIKKTLVRPISSMADAARLYAADRKNGVRDTSHFSRLRFRTGDELENLGLVLGDMERDLTEYEEDLTRITAERERIRTELDLAKRIQADTLPGVFPPFPGRTELDICASMLPAREVGGDFYDFFLIDRDHLGLVVADVSGKGVPAALFMMVAKLLLQNSALSGLGPAEVLEAVNRQICRSNREQMFVTVWFGILDLSSGHLAAANAGHEFPALKKPDGAFELYRDRHGFVLGGMENVKYREYEMDLAPGTWLFLYTDGIPEAADAQNAMFGTGRMLDALNRSACLNAKALLEDVSAAVARFAGDAPRFDDMTMLAVRYNGPGETPGPDAPR